MATIKMKTRYVLYVTSKPEAEELLRNTSVKKSVTVYQLAQLSGTHIPEWFRKCESPMLADLQADLFYYGGAVSAYIKSQPSSLFAAVDDLED